ncbi:hypothetical protein LZ30DRAFT_596571 [Colletotrichum cereale]|nr:hypothetical protein LZ30DRAFT_596571 [Colletotrichum cereale]
MSAGFTFGSLGDILQLCQISIAVGKALDDSSGSVRSYQRLRNDLDQFVQVLQNVIATYQEREHSEWLSGINFLIKSITQECMTDLEEALQYFQSKYESSLGGQGRQITPQSIGRKLGYAFKERERLQVLREKLSQNTQRLSLLLVIHNYRAARVDNNTLEKRYQEVLSKAEDISRDIQRQSIVLSEQHASVNVLITTLTTTSDHLESRATHDKNLAKEVRSIASSIQKLSVVVETSMKLLVEKRESETSHRFFRGPCSTSQPPLLFEDSFGLILGLPIEWLNSWEHLHCLISNRFEHQMGHQKVIRGEYVLEDDLSGEEITSLPWTQAMRPGLKINMAMKFHSFENESERTTEGYVCPGCGTVMQGRLDNSANLMW